MSASRRPPPAAAEAATVILARQQDGQLQVYLLKRSPKSRFMAGNFVFPGGAVDAADRQVELFANHCDLTPAEISRRLNGDPAHTPILAYAVAAIRETLEEAGVFLALQKPAMKARLEQACQQRLEAKRTGDWFAALVHDDGWQLALSALMRWARWITPELMKQRYDTRFFVALMPADQSCRPDFTETVQGVWISPREGLAANLDGKILLSPPTLVTLHQLLQYPDLQSLIQEATNRPWGPALMPRLVPLEQGAMIVEPWDPMYHQQKIKINPDDLPAAVLPVGEDFSRIWYDGTVWKPVAAAR